MTKDELQKMLDAERLANNAQVDSLRHYLYEERKQRVACAKYPCRSLECGTNRCNAVFCKGFRSKTLNAEKRRSAK